MRHSRPRSIRLRLAGNSLTNETAIHRLLNRDRWLEKRIGEASALGQDTHWFEIDRESLAIAIAAIKYVIAVQDYESSQSQ